ncbi:MAG: PilZ domain-containing protein [Thermodesulfovibrionales bacterium]|nr:PilZ domain-containing protein [Thermodesulfovibrionales bacterium]
METSEKRRHIREDIVKALEYTSYQQSNQLINFDCFVTNISQSGICLVTTAALKNGQEIILEDHVLPHTRLATVRWSKEYNGLYYSYGLEFVEQQKVPHQ